jgi:hypothetical protein
MSQQAGVSQAIISLPLKGRFEAMAGYSRHADIGLDSRARDLLVYRNHR